MLWVLSGCFIYVGAMKWGVRGGRAAAGGGLSIPAVLKPKRRGRGDARAPLDEGNGGGGREASGPVRRRWLEAHGGARRGNVDRAVKARTLSDEGDDPGLTDRVGPPVSEREATAESDKQREAESDKRSRPAESDKWSRPDSLTGWAHLSVRGRRRSNRTSGEREEMGRG
jgi:hypothetical protein